MTAMDDAAAEGARRTWAAGDYAKIAEHVAVAADAAVEAAGIAAGMAVLDVATGTGNVALRAAGRGARVTAVDLTPKLLAQARERAAAQGAAIDFLEGNAVALPVDDGAFDRVLSVFGVMFAPDHARAAAELWRACRPGGRIVVAAWTPDGPSTPIFRLLSDFAPPPPPGFQPPPLWGTEAHLRALFPQGALRATVRSVPFAYPTAEDWIAFNEVNSGPMVMTRSALEAQGRWQEARARLVDTAARLNAADDGTFLLHGEYLLAVVDKPG